MLARASICSVTRIVPSSAAIAQPTRPASIVAASTGPSSRTSEMLMTAPSRVSRSEVAELEVALHGQHHADERAGEGDDRQAEHADLVEIRNDCFVSRHPAKHPIHDATAEQCHIANRRYAIDDRGTPIGDGIGDRTEERRRRLRPVDGGVGGHKEQRSEIRGQGSVLKPQVSGLKP